ncbi:MAG: hypothetical protein WCO65_02040 [bacterium]
MSNLLPVQEKKHLKLLYKKRFAVIALRACMVLCLAASLCLLPSFIYSKNEENSLLVKKAMLDRQATGELKQSLISAIADINTRLAVFNRQNFLSPITASFIDPILQSKTSSVSLTNMSYVVNPNSTIATVTLSGVSVSREAILMFASNLKSMPGVSNVDVPITNFIKESNMPFTITLTVMLK